MNIAIIIAGGVGSRMHSEVPKQFIKVNDKHLIKDVDYKKYEDEVKKVHQIIHDKSGPGNDFLGKIE